MNARRSLSLLIVVVLLVVWLSSCRRVTAPLEPLGPCNLANGLRAPLILADGTCPGFNPKDSTGVKPDTGKKP